MIASFLFHAVSFLVIISIIVFVHEFGHYLVARLAGVKIDVFSIGFGREIWGRNDRTGTRWRVSLLPFGGYVKMYGDASEASTPLASIAALGEEEKRKTFHYKPLYKKAAIVAAGPLANFALTIVILTVYILLHGVISTEPVIGEILAGSPAAAAGLAAGDRVLAVENEKIAVFNDIPRLIMTNLGTPVTLDVERGARLLHVRLTPRQTKEKDDLGNEITRPILGFKSKELTFKSVGPARAVWEATRITYHICTATLSAVGQMITGDRSASDLKGPLGIAKLSGQATAKGAAMVFWFMAMLSANLGLVNLFPVPMLDGGHLLYYAIEAVQGRPLAKRFQEYGFRVGMAMIAMLMAFAILNDLRSLLS